jgi:SAM-dependent methyltransferase
MINIFDYKGKRYPTYLRDGNAMRFVKEAAQYFCLGEGLDVGCGEWPLPGALPVDLKNGGDANDLPHGAYDYIFSSHCLEHVVNPVATLEHWKSRLLANGILFLYLPHPDMEYWLPQNCRKHLHSWTPAAMVKVLTDLKFEDIIHSERDLMWSFAVVARARWTT